MSNQIGIKTETSSAVNPLFMSSSGRDDLKGSDIDFGLISEYLSSEKKSDRNRDRELGLDDISAHGLEENSAHGLTATDISDEEDVSSGDEMDGDGKRRKQDDNLKSKDQIDRRRERNRVLARKTRLRKKFFFESLQRQVAQLALENDMLKGIVKNRFGSDGPDHPGSSSSSSAEGMLNFAAPGTAGAAKEGASILQNADYGLMAAIQAAQRSFVITDPSIPDNPIIFASKGFLELSGYPLEQVLGRNCRFMQGPGTDPGQLDVLRKGIADGVDTSVCILNYRSDGTPFYNQIFVAALRDAQGKIINYVGVQVEIKAPVNDGKRAEDEDPLGGLGKPPKKGRPRTRDVKDKEQKPLKDAVKIEGDAAGSAAIGSGIGADASGASMGENVSMAAAPALVAVASEGGSRRNSVSSNGGNSRRNSLTGSGTGAAAAAAKEAKTKETKERTPRTRKKSNSVAGVGAGLGEDNSSSHATASASAAVPVSLPPQVSAMGSIPGPAVTLPGGQQHSAFYGSGGGNTVAGGGNANMTMGQFMMPMGVAYPASAMPNQLPHAHVPGMIPGPGPGPGPGQVQVQGQYGMNMSAGSGIGMGMNPNVSMGIGVNPHTGLNMNNMNAGMAGMAGMTPQQIAHLQSQLQAQAQAQAQQQPPQQQSQQQQQVADRSQFQLQTDAAYQGQLNMSMMSTQNMDDLFFLFEDPAQEGGLSPSGGSTFQFSSAELSDTGDNSAGISQNMSTDDANWNNLTF